MVENRPGQADTVEADTADAGRIGTHGRWRGTTPQQRRAAMAPVQAVHSQTARERRIAELIEQAPPLRPDQRARLVMLLNPTAGATPGGAA